MLNRAGRQSIVLASIGVTWLLVILSVIVFGVYVPAIPAVEMRLVMTFGWSVVIALALAVVVSDHVVQEWVQMRGGRVALLITGHMLLIFISACAAGRVQEIWPLILAVMVTPLLIHMLVRTISRPAIPPPPAEVRDVDIDAGGRQRVLINIPTPGYQDGRIRVVVVQSPSDNQVYALRVDPRVTTCNEAVAWTFNRDARAFAPAVLT